MDSRDIREEDEFLENRTANAERDNARDDDSQDGQPNNEGAAFLVETRYFLYDHYIRMHLLKLWSHMITVGLFSSGYLISLFR